MFSLAVQGGSSFSTSFSFQPSLVGPIMVLIRISLMANDIEHFFMCLLLAIHIPFWRDVSSDPWVVLLLLSFFFFFLIPVQLTYIYQFQVYTIVIQHFHILLSAHHGKCILDALHLLHPSPCSPPKFLIKHIIYKYILIFFRLSFHSLDGVL